MRLNTLQRRLLCVRSATRIAEPSGSRLAADDQVALRFDAMNLKNQFRDVETDCRDRLDDLVPPNRGGL